MALVLLARTSPLAKGIESCWVVVMSKAIVTTKRDKSDAETIFRHFGIQKIATLTAYNETRQDRCR